MSSIGVDIDALRRRLEARFGLGIACAREVVDGGEFPVFRVAGLERGVGFGIVLGRTPRQIEASFRADNFAATLLRKMSESDGAARGTFSAVKADAIKFGSHIFVGVNGNCVDELPDSSDVWRKLELDVARRLVSGKQNEDAVLECALAVCSACLAMVLALLMADEMVEISPSEEKGLPEGARMRVEVNRYERSPANRAACIAHYGTVCRACQFNFQAAYGMLGEGYIEVHHRIPVSKMGDGYFVDPVRDLVPLCSNCHSMVHRSDPPISLEDLRELLNKRLEFA